MPSDKEYKATKQIMLGKRTMNPEFRQLADFIDKSFGVRTINIIYDTIDKEERPRLNVCFEFEKEKLSFNDISGFNFDSKKQKQIADKFRQTIVNKKEGLFDLFSKSKNRKYKTDNVWIYYSAFEPIAMTEANEKIAEDKVNELKRQIANKDLWEISRCFSGTTFFLYTDEQVKQYENSETRIDWTSKYFDILKPYDEFGYFKLDKFNIYLDSKENFDKNYNGNWFYYYK